MAYDFSQIIEAVSKLHNIATPSTGYLEEILVKKGSRITPGTGLFAYRRLEAVRTISAGIEGEVVSVKKIRKGKFFGALTPLMSISTLEHIIGKEADYTVVAASEAGPHYTKGFDQKELIAIGAVIMPGQPIYLREQMKAFSQVSYTGPEPAVVSKIYFQNGQLMRQGDALLGLLSIAQCEELKRKKR